MSISQAIGQDHSSFSIGVHNLNGEARIGIHNIPRRYGSSIRHIVGGRYNANQVNRQLQASSRLQGSDHGRS